VSVSREQQGLIQKSCQPLLAEAKGFASLISARPAVARRHTPGFRDGGGTSKPSALKA
jgi:hypothetical protein